MRTRVKICGITCHEDALLAVQLGADAIGMIFCEQSPRAVSIGQAQQIVAALPPYVSKVGVFVNAPKEKVTVVTTTVSINCLQFHGDELPQYCESFSYPYIKVLRVHADVDVIGFMAQYPTASGFLLDTYVQGISGGTGRVFDWNLVPKSIAQPIILSGGLTLENVVEAIQQTNPYAVDVSSGVERSPGKKDSQKLNQFFRLIKQMETSK